MAPSAAITLPLLVLAAVGTWGTWGRTVQDGTLTALLNALHGPRPYVLPGTKSLLRSDFTGVWPVDYLLQVLVVFFWEAVDGSHPTASAIGLYFLLQYFSVLTVVYTDSFRAGNAGKWILSPLFWLMMFQGMAIGCVSPAWILTFLVSSPLFMSTDSSGSAPPLRSAKALSAAAPARILSVPLALALGYLFPALLMALPSPGSVSNAFQQKAVAVWNVFPIWVASIHKLLELAFSLVSGAADPASTGTALASQQHKSHLVAVRLTNTIAMALSAGAHITFVLLSVSTSLFPAIFAKPFLTHLTPAALFAPPIAIQSAKTVGDGVRSFMLWDQAVGYTAVLAFFSYQFLCAAKAAGFEVRGLVAGVSAAISALIIGPGATAVGVSWARDELLFAEDQQQGAQISEKGHLQKVPAWKF